MVTWYVVCLCMFITVAIFCAFIVAVILLIIVIRVVARAFVRVMGAGIIAAISPQVTSQSPFTVSDTALWLSEDFWFAYHNSDFVAPIAAPIAQALFMCLMAVCHYTQFPIDNCLCIAHEFGFFDLQAELPPRQEFNGCFADSLIQIKELVTQCFVDYCNRKYVALCYAFDLTINIIDALYIIYSSSKHSKWL